MMRYPLNLLSLTAIIFCGTISLGSKVLAVVNETCLKTKSTCVGGSDKKTEKACKKGSPTIYILYTGGTIGSAGHPLSPVTTDAFHNLLITKGGGYFTTDKITYNHHGATKCINYVLDGFVKTLDSSNMDPSDWVTIARKITTNYKKYKGFVILHGTDTMAWTSSALSYLLNGLTKSVIVTGSQVPLSKCDPIASPSNCDALNNLLYAAVIAAQEIIPEVGLYTYRGLLRGNRSVKVHSQNWLAFDTPNYSQCINPWLPCETKYLVTTTKYNPYLERNKLDYQIYPNHILAAPTGPHTLDNDDFLQQTLLRIKNIQYNLLTQVAVRTLSIYPGITYEDVIKFKQQQMGKNNYKKIGVILKTYGAGNAPSNAPFLKGINEIDKAGITIVDITRVIADGVHIDYATGSALIDQGVINGYNLTEEAATAKLNILLAEGLEQREAKIAMQKIINGDMEITPH